MTLCKCSLFHFRKASVEKYGDRLTDPILHQLLVFWVLSFATAVSCPSRVWANNILYISHSQWISSNHLWPNLSTENSAQILEKYEKITIACGYMTQFRMVFSQFLTSITLDLDRRPMSWMKNNGWYDQDMHKFCCCFADFCCIWTPCFVFSNRNSSSQIIIKSLDRRMSRAVSDLLTLSWWSLSFSMSFASLTQLRSLYIVCESLPRIQNMPKSLLVPVSQRNMT